MKEVKKAQFKVGQVVRVDVDWYRKERKAQQYQKITRVWPWPEYKKQPYGYTLANGDNSNEKFLRALTKKEAGQ